MIDENLTVTDTIVLAKKEVEEARKKFKKQGMPCQDFLDWDLEECGPEEGDKEDMGDGMKIIHAPYTAYCCLCKKLTEFATVHCPNTGKEGEMSEPFPSEEYRKLCIENVDRLREEWERRGPQFGDSVYHKTYGHGIITSIYDAPWYYRIEYSPGNLKTSLENVIPLFQPRQIIEMLLQRGLRIVIHTIPTGETKVRAYWPRYMGEGPDPACALLRAWLEVVKEE